MILVNTYYTTEKTLKVYADSEDTIILEDEINPEEHTFFIDIDDAKELVEMLKCAISDAEEKLND